MSIKLQRVDDEYYVIVNRRELYRQARKLKFRNSALIKGDLSDIDIDAMKASGKAFVLIIYDEDEDYSRELDLRLRRADIKTVLWNLMTEGDDPDQLEGVKSLEEAVSAFPNRTAVETALVDDGYIHDTDYANRCGNCSAKMVPGDNYCKYCGAKRGEGAFEPFYNPVYCVYGPPISRKYTCKKCGHKWITAALGGGDECKFCPSCGNKEPDIVRTDIKDFGDVIGLVPDEDDPKKQLLTVEQVLQILAERDEENEKKVFIDAGIKEAERLDDCISLTETEGRRLTVARFLLIMTEGHDIDGFHEKGITCPTCRSRLIAAISYPLFNDPYCDDEERSSFEGKHVAGNGNEVVLHSGAIVDWEKMIKGEEWDDRGQAFICMQCGERFGKFVEYY